MPCVDFRIPRPDDDSEEGILAAVSEPLWSLWSGSSAAEDAESINGFFGELNEGQRHILAVAICRSEIANGRAPTETKARNDALNSLPDGKTDKVFESVNEKWDELDSSDKNSFAVFCARYIRSNPAYFFLP